MKTQLDSDLAELQAEMMGIDKIELREDLRRAINETRDLTAIISGDDDELRCKRCQDSADVVGNLVKRCNNCDLLEDLMPTTPCSVVLENQDGDPMKTIVKFKCSKEAKTEIFTTLAARLEQTSEEERYHNPLQVITAVLDNRLDTLVDEVLNIGQIRPTPPRLLKLQLVDREKRTLVRVNHLWRNAKPNQQPLPQGARRSAIDDLQRLATARSKIQERTLEDDSLIDPNLNKKFFPALEENLTLLSGSDPERGCTSVCCCESHCRLLHPSEEDLRFLEEEFDQPFV